jgi:glycopeptide antibiotics resistance protein
MALVIEFVPYFFIIGIFALILLEVILWRKKFSAAYIFFFSIFWIYLLLLIGVILFPMPIPQNSNEFLSGRQVWITLSRVNLIPFDYGQFRHLDPSIIYIREIFDNILLTLPFGFGICLIKNVRWRELPWLALGVGLGTETAQLIMCLVLGSQYRGVDINDTIMNSLGVGLGYLLFRLFSCLYITITRRFHIKHKGIFAYLYSQTIWYEKKAA